MQNKLEKLKHNKMVAAAIIVAVVILFATIATPFLLENPEEITSDTGTEDEETMLGIAPLIILIGAAIAGVVIGWLAHWAFGQELLNGTTTATSDISEDVLRYESEFIYAVIYSNVQLLENSISGYADIWQFTNSYFMRQAEVAATELFQSGEDYNIAYILARSGIMTNVAKLFENMEEGVDVTFDYINTKIQSWIDGGSDYSGMKANLTYGSDNVSNTITATGTSGQSLDIMIRNLATITSSSFSYVYLDARELWVSQNTTITAYDIYGNAGTTYTLTTGYNDLTLIEGFESGIYQLASGCTYAGSIVPTSVANAATVYAGVVIENNGSYIFGRYSDGDLIINNNTYSEFYLTSSNNYGYETAEIDLLELLGEWDGMLSAAKNTLLKAETAAAAQWSLYELAGEALVTLSVSSLAAVGLDVDSDELFLLSVIYLEQVADYVERHNLSVDGLTEAGFTISAESLNLVVRGDIYDENGLLLYEDVVFSPYVWLEEMTVQQGTTTSFSQTGYIVIWGESEDISGGYTTDLSSYSLISAVSGYSFDTKQVIYNGVYTTTAIELTPNLTLSEWNTVEATAGTTVIVIPTVVDLADYIAIILIEAAVIFLLLGIYAGFASSLWLLLAIIMLLLAVFGSSFIAGLIT